MQAEAAGGVGAWFGGRGVVSDGTLGGVVVGAVTKWAVSA